MDKTDKTEKLDWMQVAALLYVVEKTVGDASTKHLREEAMKELEAMKPEEKEPTSAPSTSASSVTSRPPFSSQSKEQLDAPRHT